MCRLNVDASFWGDDKCCHRGFRFSWFIRFREKKLPYGFNLYFSGFFFVFEEAMFREKL